MSEPSDKHNPGVRAVVDYGGLLAFVGAFLILRFIQHAPSAAALLAATWWLVGGSAAALAVGLVVERRLAPLPLFAGLTALVFGALALAFHDPRFIKIKPTVTNAIFACIMLGGVVLKKNPLKALFSTAINLSPETWRRLTIHYGVFFLVMAALNEIVWRTQPDSVWVLFKFPGMEILILLFSASQAPMMVKDMKAMEAAAEMEL